MPLKPAKSIDELCYPFIYETSHLCDFEVITDELCSHIGAILALIPMEFADVTEDLERLQPLVWHLNGSIRGKMAVDESDLQWLIGRYRHYRGFTSDQHSGFVLPRGEAPVPQLNLARSVAKKAIRVMVRLDQEGLNVPERLSSFCNAMCNLFFVLTRYINHLRGVAEIPFESRSYGG